mmetsp:Transcript_124910/g.400114  ORF Transcript_124910/g.400114 Transcript_124910/m.400114 type:complete len:506 (+) Transcript_124910:94-1611(+)
MACRRCGAAMFCSRALWIGVPLWVAVMTCGGRSGAAQAAAVEGSCPAAGGPGCGDGAVLPAEDVKCVRWRQTGGCNPNGPLEQRGDKACTEEIPMGSSGYCHCGTGATKRKARLSTCDHRPFKCATECLQVLRYTCVSWRQTGGCSADGAREASKDQACDASIEPRSSGFCECGDGRVIRKPGCEHGEFAAPFKCEDECGREPDLYEELGIDTSAPEKVVKQAFRKLSLKYHPDKTQDDPKLTARFAAIREAYDVIGDPDKRAIYDSAGLKMLDDVKNGKVEKGPAMNGEVKVSLEQLYKGAEFKTSITRKVICRGCAESPTDRCRKCNAGCANEVEVRQVQMGPFLTNQQVEVPSKQKCRHEQTELLVEIEPGMAPGDTLTFKSMGEHQPKKIPGDVVLKIAELTHKVFRRSGSDLHTDVSVSLKEALLGFQRSLTHLDGRRIELSFDAITRPNNVMQIVGEGMPSRGDPTQQGNLYVKLSIDMPEDGALGAAQREWLAANFPG